MAASAQSLPIDAVLSDIVAALGRERRLVLIAPPGAGKTTRVPAAVLDAGILGTGGGEIVVLQPRRLAARMAAERVAHERGESVGRSVGYEVRFDRRLGPDTRIRFVTEGVLTRQLLSDPTLSRVSAVLIDEFHERHLAGDLALALLRRLQARSRPELMLAVMSATMDPGPVAAFLGDCPVIESTGRHFPVDVEYAPARAGEPLDKQVAAAVRRLLQHRLDGDVLVFLPGAAEIRRAMAACADNCARAGLLIVPLHGDLPAAEQDRALARTAERKLILATNVAETSITIDGVVCVIDSGLARMARHSPWSGIASLGVEPISKASAAQRAGRAGRTRPGRCIRLYDRHDHDTRRAFDTAEVMRADLADAALGLHALGVQRLRDFGWLDAPPERALAAADELLRRLGAIDDQGALTAVGTRMLRFPVHPRQARMIVEAEARGVAAQGCALAGLAGSKELRLARRTAMGATMGAGAAPVSGPSDLLEDLDALADARARGLRGDRLRAAGLDPAVAGAALRTQDKLTRLTRGRGGPGGEIDESIGSDRLDKIDRYGKYDKYGTSDISNDPIAARARPASPNARTKAETKAKIDAETNALLIATLAGYPDRVGRRRRPGSSEFVLAGAGSAMISPTSVVTEAALVVAVDVEEHGRGSARISRASAVEIDWLLDLYIDQIRDTDELLWQPERERVERVRRMYYGDLVIDEQWDPAGGRARPEDAAAVLAAAALASGLDRFCDRFCDRQALEAWRARLRFAADSTGNAALLPPSDDELVTALTRLCIGLTSFAELERISIVEHLDARLSPDEQRLLARVAPAHISLPGRRRVPVHYESDRPPWIESRLQDFFGLAEGPRVGLGRVALVLHLLAPNKRAVQVTSDLSGFWSRHYPALRRQLMRRYPRHPWPEDPFAEHSR